MSQTDSHQTSQLSNKDKTVYFLTLQGMCLSPLNSDETFKISITIIATTLTGLNFCLNYFCPSVEKHSPKNNEVFKT